MFVTKLFDLAFLSFIVHRCQCINEIIIFSFICSEHLLWSTYLLLLWTCNQLCVNEYNLVLRNESTTCQTCILLFDSLKKNNSVLLGIWTFLFCCGVKSCSRFWLLIWSVRSPSLVDKKGGSYATPSTKFSIGECSRYGNAGIMRRSQRKWGGVGGRLR